MDQDTRPLTKREAVAVFFAASLISARDDDNRDIPSSRKERELMRDAFSLADRFLDCAEEVDRCGQVKV